MKTYTIQVPDGLRLGQHIYNVLSENGYEHNIKIATHFDGKFTDASYTGVDCFYVEDEELLKLLNN